MEMLATRRCATPMRRRIRAAGETAVCLLFVVLLSACSQDDPIATSDSEPIAATAPSSAEAMDDDDAEAAILDIDGRDLEVMAEADPVGDDGSTTIRAALRSLDRGTIFEPTLVIAAPEGVAFPNLPNECTLVGAELRCVLVGYFDQGTTRLDELFPTDWLPLEIDVRVDPAVDGSRQLTVTAISRRNGLDNDPDPTNNVATLSLVPD